MPPTGRMRHLTTVQGTFHGRLLAARLGAAGVLTELRGASEGPYPFQGQVDILVPEADLDLAREILLADAVDAAVDADAIEAAYSHGLDEEEADQPSPGRLERGLMVHQRRIDRLGTVITLALVITLIVVGLAVTAR